jgi:hypothetical protein
MFSQRESADTVCVSTVRKLLLAVLLVSLTGSAFGAGTFASFNASTTNASSTFSTGSIVLSNKTTSGSACVSTSTGDVSGATGNTDTNAHTCDTLFSLTTAKPGTTATVNLTLVNVGSVAASTLTGVVTACQNVAFTGTYHGSTASLICGTGNGLKVQVQEYSDNLFASPVAKCVYPVNGSAACGATFGYLGGFAGSTMASTTFSAPGMAALTGTKYLKLSLNFPDNGASAVGTTPVLDNAYMGISADFSITWTITQ